MTHRRSVTPIPDLRRLTAAGLGLGLVLVAALALIQRPAAPGSVTIPSGIAVLPSATSATPSENASGTPGSPGSSTGSSPATTGDGRVFGTATAPVAIDVWSDYQCPACGYFANQILPRLLAEYADRGAVRIVYHDFAFLGPESIDAAVGARIAAAAGKFDAYHRLVYANQQGENQGAFARPRLEQLAVAAGLDGQAFLAGLDDPTLIAAVHAETEQGRVLGVNATPTLVIGGKLTRGVPTWDQLVVLLAAQGAT